MYLYRKIKFISKLSLLLEAIVCVSAGIYLFYSNYIHIVTWFMMSIFVFIIPQVYITFLIDKLYVEEKENISKISDCIKKIDFEISDDFRETDEYEQVYESISEVNSKINKNKITSEIISDILVSAAKNFDFENFLDDALIKIMELMNSNWIVFYIVNKTTNKLEIKSSIGFGKSIYSQFDISIGEGFIGQAAENNKIKIIKDIPDDSIYISKTFMGKIKPKNILVVPVSDFENNNDVLGVLALASLYEYTDEDIENINKIKKYITYAVLNGIYYNKNQRLTNELKFQNQLIQNLNEDLENKIKERTVFLNNIINSIKDVAIVSVDKSNRITLFSKGAEKLLMINSEEAIGQNIEIVSYGSEEVREKVLSSIEDAIKNGTSLHICDVKRKDGTYYSAHIELFALYNEVGENNGVTIVVKDTSFIKKIVNSAEIDKKMAETLIDESTRAIMIVNEEYEILKINKNSEYILDVKAENAINKKVWEFFDDSNEVKNFIIQIMTGDKQREISTKLLNSDIKVMLKTRLLIDKGSNLKKLMIFLH